MSFAEEATGPAAATMTTRRPKTPVFGLKGKLPEKNPMLRHEPKLEYIPLSAAERQAAQRVGPDQAATLGHVSIQQRQPGGPPRGGAGVAASWGFAGGMDGEGSTRQALLTYIAEARGKTGRPQTAPEQSGAGGFQQLVGFAPPLQTAGDWHSPAGINMTRPVSTGGQQFSASFSDEIAFRERRVAERRQHAFHPNNAVLAKQSRLERQTAKHMVVNTAETQREEKREEKHTEALARIRGQRAERNKKGAQTPAAKARDGAGSRGAPTTQESAPAYFRNVSTSPVRKGVRWRPVTPSPEPGARAGRLPALIDAAADGSNISVDPAVFVFAAEEEDDEDDGDEKQEGAEPSRETDLKTGEVAVQEPEPNPESEATEPAVVSNADMEWVCSLFDGSTPAAAALRGLASVIATAIKGSTGDAATDSVAESIGNVDVISLESQWRDGLGSQASQHMLQLVAGCVQHAQQLQADRGGVGAATAKGGELALGSPKDFDGGLVGLLGMPSGLNESQWITSMASEHCDVEHGQWGASQFAWTTFDYHLTTSPMQEYLWVTKSIWNGQPADHAPGGCESRSSEREDMRLRRQAAPIDLVYLNAPKLAFDMLCREAAAGVLVFEVPEETFTKNFEELGVNRAEIISLRMYTGPLLALYNTVLQSGGKVLAGIKYPHQRSNTDGRTTGKFVTTIHTISSGILKLSKITPAASVYRGISPKDVPNQLLQPDEFGSKSGISVGFISTTTDIDLASRCSSERNLSHILEYQMDRLSRGAMVQFLSQYTHEAEVVFAPLTGMEVQAIVVRGSARHFICRLTVNQRSIRIEELVAQRKVLHIAGLRNLLAELKATKGPASVMDSFDKHIEHVQCIPAGSFNDDALYRAMVTTSVGLSSTLKSIIASFAECNSFLDYSTSTNLLAYMCLGLGPIVICSKAAEGTVDRHGGVQVDLMHILEAQQATKRRVSMTNSAVRAWRSLSAAAHEKLTSLADRMLPIEVTGAKTLTALLELGVGGCLKLLVDMNLATFSKVIGVWKNADANYKKKLSTADTARLNGDAATTSVLVSLLAQTKVQEIGPLPFKEIESSSLRELNMLQANLSSCEAGVVAHYLASESNRLDRVIVTPKLTVTLDVFSEEIGWADSAIGGAECCLAVALLASSPVAVTTLDLSDNSLSGFSRHSRDSDTPRHNGTEPSPWYVVRDKNVFGISGLSRLVQLSKLHVVDCQLGPAGIAALAGSIGCMERLRELDISGNLVFGSRQSAPGKRWDSTVHDVDKDTKGWGRLIAAVKQLPVEQLLLRRIGMGPIGLCSLEMLFKEKAETAKTLRLLDISENFCFGTKEKGGYDDDRHTMFHDADQSQDGWAGLVNGLMQSTLSELVLKDIGIGPKGLTLFSVLLTAAGSQIKSHVSSIVMDGNPLSGTLKDSFGKVDIMTQDAVLTGWEVFCDALEVNSTMNSLSVLSFNNCLLGPKAKDMLAKKNIIGMRDIEG